MGLDLSQIPIAPEPKKSGKLDLSQIPLGGDTTAPQPAQAMPQAMPSDRANTVLDLAKQHPELTPGFIDKNLETVQQANKMPDFEAMQRTSPVTTSWLAQSPENQARAFDDIPNLQAHEAVMSQGEPPGIFKRAFRYLTEASSTEQTAQAQNLMAMSQATGKPPSEIKPGQEVEFARQRGIGTQPTGVELANAGMTAAIFAGGGEAMAAGKLLAYTGRTALTIGAFEGLNKLIPVDKLIPTDANDATKTAIEIADFAVKGAIAGGLSGAVRPVGEFIKAKFADKGIELPQAEESKIINSALDKMPESKPAPTNTEQTLNALSDLAKENKLAKLPNGTYADYVQNVADEHDKGILTIKSDDFNKYFQEKGIDPKAEIEGLAAHATGTGPDFEGTVEIPTGQFMSRYANTEHISGLAPFTQFEAQEAAGPSAQTAPAPSGATAKSILSKIQNVEDYELQDGFGLRVLHNDDQSRIGDILKPSQRMEDNIPTGEYLKGTSTVGIDKPDESHISGALQKIQESGYPGNRIALVIGDKSGYGEDPGETILKDPRVLHIFGGGAEASQEAPAEEGVLLPGMEAKEVPKAPPDADAEAREALKSKEPEAVTDITATKSPIRAFLDLSRKVYDFTGDIAKSFYRLEAANEVDRIHAFGLVGKSKGTPADYEAIYQHDERVAAGMPSDPLTPDQARIKAEEIDPLHKAASMAFARLKEKEIPIEQDTYSGKIVANRGGLIERMKAGIQGLAQGGALRKSTGSLKSRVMWALEDEEGNRKIVSIKGGDVVEWKDKVPEYLGQRRQPSMPKVSEYYDKPVMDKLKALADSLGIKHERVLKGEGLGGNRLGVSFTGGNLIKTKFATPEAVMLHEIGHQLDERYNLKEEFLRTQYPKGSREGVILNEESRKLADLKWENAETSEYFKKYVRKGPEKIAGMFEAYLQAPERFKEVAPNLYKKFVDYVGSNPELKPILDIKPSMVYGKNTIGGPQEPMTFIDKDGKKWAIKDALTDEIEKNTTLTYHKNALITNLMNYVNLRKVDRATEYLEGMKESPEFQGFATKIGSPEYDDLMKMWQPGEYKESQVPQLRGYVFPKKVADAFDYFYKQDPMSAYGKINQVMRNSIFFNPLIHVPNILNHWGVDRGVSPWLNPMDYPRLASSTMRAWRAVTTLNQDYIDVMEAGGHLLSAGTRIENLPEMLLQKAGMELNQNRGLAKIGEDLGLGIPRLVKAIYDFSGKVTWATNDIATLEAIFERMEHGRTMEDAVADTAKHIPNYRIPSSVLGSNAIAKFMRGDSQVTMFGAYHYGALKSYGEMLTSLGKGLVGKESPAEVARTVDKIAALIIGTYVLYPAIDKIVQVVTGNNYASIRRAGASTVISNAQKLFEAHQSRAGITSVDLARMIQGSVTPAPLLKLGMESWFGRDSYNGRPINIPQKIMGSISPLDYGRRIYSGDMTGAQLGWGLAGIKSPKRRPR